MLLLLLLRRECSDSRWEEMMCVCVSFKAMEVGINRNPLSLLLHCYRAVVNLH
jgi:hypothetical protein